MAPPLSFLTPCRRPLPPRAHRALRILSLTTLAACGGASLDPDQPRAAAAPASDAMLIEWAHASGSRGDEPPGADAYLLLLPPGKPTAAGRHLAPSCIRATSVLPSPAPDNRIFLIIDGALHVMPSRDAMPQLVKGGDPGLHLRLLLAIRAEASPLQILAAAQSEGADSEMQAWTLTVGDTDLRSAARTPADDPARKDLEAFHARYRAPRCLPGGKRCVRAADDGNETFIEIKATATTPAQSWSLGKDKVRDVAWQSERGDSLYVLVACPAKSPSEG